MHVVTDLHLHSKYSRAVSPAMTLAFMSDHARQKGLNLLTASDFTHPLWFKELKNLLIEAGEGVYKLPDTEETRGAKEVLFMLSTEISSIYKHGDKLRRIHNLIFVPSLQAAEKCNQELIKRGCNLTADGRPIVGISSRDLLELLLTVDERAFLIPCHVWTPHFGVYGSASGFDSLEEAYGDLSSYIYGIETGLSSDPDMNWQVPELMNRTILSFSDAHSAPKMSREATVMDLEAITYENVRQAIMRLATKSDTKNKIIYTLEFYPEEGKYHFSGHRNCKVVLGPDEVREKGTACPVCKRRLTEGVFMRVEQLSDSKLFGRAVPKVNEHGVKWYTDNLRIQPPYVKLVPLLEIVAEGMRSTVASQKAKNMFAMLCAKLDSELNVLLHAPIGAIETIAGEHIAEGVLKVRGGDIAIDPGFDGEFGKVKIWQDGAPKKEAPKAQLRLDI